MMPTAAKLVAALAFAALGFFSAELIKPLMPEGTQFGFFSLFTAFIGVVCGWFVMGSLAGESYGRSAASGIQTIVTMVFWSVVLLAFYEMILLSMKLRYDGPMEAVQGMFVIILNYCITLLNVGVIATLLIGGVLGGLLAEWSSRQWR